MLNLRALNLVQIVLLLIIPLLIRHWDVVQEYLLLEVRMPVGTVRKVGILNNNFQVVNFKIKKTTFWSE